MRRLLFIFLSLVFLQSCNFQQNQKTENHTYVNYKQKVNGYDVSVKILPDSIHEGYFSDISNGV